MLKPSLLALLFLLSAPLAAQGYVDVLRDETYVYSPTGLAENADKFIHRLNADGSHEIIALPDSETTKFIGWPRPRVRLGRVWISNGKKMFSAPLDRSGKEWEPVKLPEGINHFRDFDIISDTDAIICGCLWEANDDNKTLPARYDMHFVLNHRTGIIKKTMEEIEPYVFAPETDFFAIYKQADSHLCWFDPYILIVGELTGKITIFSTDNGSVAALQVVPVEDIPKDAEQAVNNRRRIDWVGPLAGNEALLRCSKPIPLPKEEKKYTVSVDENGLEKAVPALLAQFRQEYYFCTMNLKTGKVRREGAEYRGFDASKSRAALFERDGKLLSVPEVLAGKTKVETEAPTPANEAAPPHGK